LVIASATACVADGYKDFNAGVAASDFADRNTAIDSLSRAIASSNLPDHLRPVALLARGQDYVQIGKYDAAIADFTEALRLKPGWPDAYIGRCSAYASKSMYPEGIADCTEAAKQQPNNWRLLSTRDIIYEGTGRWDDAIADYSAIIPARPDDPDLVFARSGLYFNKHDFDKALEDANKAHELSPRWAAPYERMGQSDLAKGNFSDTVIAYKLAIDRAPNDAIDYMAKGMGSWGLGRFDDAADAFEDSLNKDNLQPYAFLWLLLTETKLGAKVSPEIAARFASADLAAWPGPIESLYLGKSTPDPLLEAKGLDQNGEDKACTTKFFVGEWYLMQGNAAKARDVLASEQTACASNPMYGQLAATEAARVH
jgi:tetratricopeptide (TPR) repeat protein